RIAVLAAQTHQHRRATEQVVAVVADDAAGHEREGQLRPAEALAGVVEAGAPARALLRPCEVRVVFVGPSRGDGDRSRPALPADAEVGMWRLHGVREGVGALARVVCTVEGGR